ncbi:hypothetical protein T492DRAFT_1103468 [Pavlovales sp. CCMP2436]|nr:hypothetical protein T492DRAFT_1103468 [Pavlovales sp. CCMP2436]
MKWHISRVRLLYSDHRTRIHTHGCSPAVLVWPFNTPANALGVEGGLPVSQWCSNNTLISLGPVPNTVCVCALCVLPSCRRNMNITNYWHYEVKRNNTNFLIPAQGKHEYYISLGICVLGEWSWIHIRETVFGDRRPDQKSSPLVLVTSLR